MNKLIGLLLVAAGSTAQAADVDWSGWSFDYSTNNNSSGLVLTNVTFGDKQILGKVSMPVMRVEYENDVCGPYADILSTGALRNPGGGAQIQTCENQAVCRRTFTQDGENMLEIGANWQIGEYQIYQTYYFSENGYFDSRVYSRGLQCQIQHGHHAQWMFDFDIDGTANDQIAKGASDIQLTEFNDLKANTDFWTIQDKVTGSNVRLVPSSDDGEPNNFSKWDLAGRAFNAAEIGRWRNGARGEIGELFNTPAENIDGADLVLWYVSHLPHSPEEGSSIWHASGPRLEVLPSTDPIDPVDPVVPVDPPVNTEMVSYEYYEGSWAALPNFASLTPAATGSTNAIALNVGQRADNFAVRYNASITVSEAGLYNFYTSSDDGSQLFIDGQVVVDNDGLHGTREREGSINLTAGVHAIVVTYFERTGGNTLSVNWAGPSFTKTSITGALEAPVDPVDPVDPVVPVDPVDPIVPVDPPSENNMLVNGGFEEATLGAWSNCAAAENVELVSTDQAQGAQAVRIFNGGCIYQEQPSQANDEFELSCSAARSGGNWTTMQLSYLDSNYGSLLTEVSQISIGSDYSNFSVRGAAPAGTAYVTALLYSEDNTRFDNCNLVALDGAVDPVVPVDPVDPVDPVVPVDPVDPVTPVDPVQTLLTNGDFESNLNGWYSCAAASLATLSTDADASANALSARQGGCMYQEFDIQPGGTYSMDCRAKSESTAQYTSVSLTMMSNSYAALETKELPVSTTAFANYAAQLTAPANSRYGSVVVYSEDVGVFDNCIVSSN